jgi:hypothetical protein
VILGIWPANYSTSCGFCVRFALCEHHCKLDLFVRPWQLFPMRSEAGEYRDNGAPDWDRGGHLLGSMQENYLVDHDSWLAKLL